MTFPPPGGGPRSPWAPRPGYQRPGTSLPGLVDGPVHPAQGGPSVPEPVSQLPPQVPGYQADWPWAAGGWGSPHTSVGLQWREVLRYVLVALGVMGLLGILWLISLSVSGVSQLLGVIVLAAVPLLIVLAVVFWIDRWEPEPFKTLVVAFLWGAGVSTVVSMLVNTGVTLLALQSIGSLQEAETLAAVISAPIVEETAKGLGVLLIFLVWRRTFNGAVDGLVYAAVIAAGFAFCENILYFVSYSDALIEVFIIRGVFSPFAHVTFTACTGLAIGFSARRRSRLAWLWWAPVGLGAAIVLHAFWNGIVATAGFVYYFLVEVPFFLACIGLVIWLRWAERMSMRRRLDDYGRAGWFTYQEVMMLTTSSGRSGARRWARSRGPASLAAMKAFQKTSAELAQLRQQAVDGHAEHDFAARERDLLVRLSQARQVFLGGSWS